MKFFSKNWMLSIASFLFLPLGLYAPRGLAPLFVLTAVLFLLSEWTERKTLKISSWHLYLLAMLLPIFGAMSSLWSITPLVSFRMSLTIGATILVGLLFLNNSVLKNSDKDSSFEKFLILGGLIGFSLLLTENVTDAGVSRAVFDLFGLKQDRQIVNREGPILLSAGVSAATLFIWPLALILFRRRNKILSIIIVGYCCMAIFTGTPNAPKLALGTGFASMIITGFAYRFGPKLIILAAVFLTLLAPAIPNLLPDPTDPRSSLTKYYSNSDIHRYMIWNTTVNHIKDKPILGHGMDSTRALYSPNDRILTPIDIMATGERKRINAEPIPLHPHNAILQIWVELGVVGAGFFALLLGSIFLIVKKVTNDRWEAATCYGMIISGLTISSLSYGIWQSWWLSALFLAAVFMGATTQNSLNTIVPPENNI